MKDHIHISQHNVLKQYKDDKQWAKIPKHVHSIKACIAEGQKLPEAFQTSHTRQDHVRVPHAPCILNVFVF